MPSLTQLIRYSTLAVILVISACSREQGQTDATPDSAYLLGDFLAANYAEDMQDLLFAFGRDFKYFYPAFSNDIKATAFFSFGENNFSFINMLLNGNLLYGGNLIFRKAAENGNLCDNIQIFFHISNLFFLTPKIWSNGAE